MIKDKAKPTHNIWIFFLNVIFVQIIFSILSLVLQRAKFTQFKNIVWIVHLKMYISLNVTSVRLVMSATAANTCVNSLKNMREKPPLVNTCGHTKTTLLIFQIILIFLKNVKISGTVSCLRCFLSVTWNLI